jgi:hypothetical protein
MAISVYFRKVRQDDTVLEYEFGETPASTDRRVIVDLPTMRVWPVDGRGNVNFDACARRISVLFGQTGSWPETGGVQS